MAEVYQGVTHGFHGPITANVTIEDQKIKKIDAEYSQAATVGALGIARMKAQILAQQSTDVDAVTGASTSTNAFKAAVEKAIAVSQQTLSEEAGRDINVPSPKSGPVDEVTGASANPLQAPTNPSPVTPAEVASEHATFDATYDVIVVGAGGAGLSAAVQAASEGLSVLICEKAGIAGGTTNYSGGVVQAAGTKYQKQFTAYQNDTPEKHANEWLAAGENSVDADLVRDLATNAPKNIEWLADLGIKWHAVYGHTQIPYEQSEDFADRIHVYEGGGGMAGGTVLAQTLLKRAIEKGAKISYDTTVTTLITANDHSITGVKARVKNQVTSFKARYGVILATASIDHNQALAFQYSPQQYNDLLFNTCLSAKTDTGDGILLGQSVGAAIQGMGGCIDFDGKTGNGTDNRVPAMPMIFVNGRGKRFVCEDTTYAYQYRAIFQQEKQFKTPTYMIFADSSLQADGAWWTADSLSEDVKKGTVIAADSLTDLATAINVPVDNLTASVTAWNQQASAGQDTEFGRQTGIQALAGKWYAYRNRATNLGAIGGLKINVDCQVLDNFDRPITNLYAAGLNAGGWIGQYYPGSGTAIAGIVHQGRKVAEKISTLAAARMS